MSANFDLKEQIRDYWSARAATFDDSFSHQVTEGVELDAWKAMYAGTLGLEEKHILDIGCGTGEVSKILFAAGHRVTGMDFSDAMLAKARVKHADKGGRATYLSGDAEATKLPNDSFDAVTCRHLVWTLLEPEKALVDWYRVLRPGGHLVIFDGNFMHKTLKDKIIRKIINLIEPDSPLLCKEGEALQNQNTDIRRQLPFAAGFSFSALEKMAGRVGFQNIERLSYTPIRRAQRKIARPNDWLRTFTTDRFVLHARKI